MKIQDERVMAVASPGFSARHPIATLADLAEAPLLSVEGADWAWMTWGSFLKATGAPPARPDVRRFNSMALLCKPRATGRGWRWAGPRRSRQ